jgi:hypothetical protein
MSTSSPDRIIPFTTADGFTGNVIQVGRSRRATKGPVLLVHGAGVRGNLFRPPNRPNFVEYLLDRGYDVWLENWRASIDLGKYPPLWTLDQAGLFDHPAAVKTVCRETGQKTIKAVVHCQGSTSFTISAVAGLVPQVSTIVSNAVSLHPVVPRTTCIKSKLALKLVSRFTDYLDAQWGSKVPPPNLMAKFILLLTRVFHHECQNLVCKLSSFSYGFGLTIPVLWRHENLTAETHEWIKDEFGKVPIRFFQQMARCFSAGHLVKFETGTDYKELPDDYTVPPPKTDACFAFFAGESNACFRKESQEKSFDYFNRQRRNYHSLHILPGYGHLDMFIGKDAARDVFPIMAAKLEK